MAEHRILVHVVETPNGPRALPDIRPNDVIRVNDFVSYFSPDGIVEITFDTNGSPFSNASPDIITSGQRRQVVNAKTSFFCKCKITRPNGPVVEWKEKQPPPESGGDHDVRP